MPETSTTEPAKKAPSHKASARALISAERIARRVQEMGEQISAVYADIDSPLVLVVILKGATVFAADLLRSLSIPAELEFVSAASYGSGTSPGRSGHNFPACVPGMSSSGVGSYSIPRLPYPRVNGSGSMLFSTVSARSSIRSRACSWTTQFGRSARSTWES